MAIISCGIFNIKYLYFISIYALTMVFLWLTLYYLYGIKDIHAKYEYYNNVLLTILVSNFGQIFCFIPEVIIDKCILKKKQFKLTNPLCIFKKQKSKLAIEYIFNDLSDKITKKDILYIFLASILLILADYIKVFVQVKDLDFGDQLILNEQYNAAELLLIVLFAYLIYKMKFYKHQLYSVILLILLGIFRYLLKIYYYYGLFKAQSLFIDLFIQFLAAVFESIVIIFSKGLMEYKFFSPYKVCYIFGIINTIITLILLIIFTFIKSEKNIFFALEYKGDYYLDNLYSILDLGYKLIGLFFASIFYGVLKLLLNFTINRFTVCHTFLLLQNREVTCNLFNELANQKGMIFIGLIMGTHLLDFFIILVFLEIIELKFCGLDKNIKRNIKDRGELEATKSFEDLRKNSENLVERNASTDTSFYNEE